MRRIFFAPLGAVLALGIASHVSACDEQLPRAFDLEVPPVAAPLWGLDTRPVSVTCSGAVTAAPAPYARLSFERVSPVTFDSPVGVVAHSGRLYVIQQGGNDGSVTTGAKIRLLGSDLTTAPTVIDVSSRAAAGGESGLLGLAFHPKFAQNHFVFLYYTSPAPMPDPSVAFQSVVARYESPDGGLTLDLATEKRILVVDQPFANHNGGTIAFGNDGFLYFALGDGGGSGDSMNYAQNPSTLLGKMVRIDVDSGDPYAIPPTNPFASGGGGRPEIYAIGFRNPFRFSFDVPTGDLWLGDVGQSSREEIDKVVLGGNYGWSIREGKQCYKPLTGCSTTGLIDPVVDHDRNDAKSIIGGVVYHGTRLPELTGKYVYADVYSGFFWAIPTNEPAPVPVRLDVGLPSRTPVGFTLDSSGEIVFADLTGSIWRIVPKTVALGPPEKLSDTGCTGTVPLFPYDVNVPQWLDGASADRYLAIPDGAKIVTKPDGRLELPPGSVAIRTIRSTSQPIETQLLQRRPGGEWAFSAYGWNGTATEATLVPTTTCPTCHNEAAGVTLGLEAAQLERTFAYRDRPADQLATLEHLGMLSAPIVKGTYSRLAPLDSYESLDLRARSYLHANCAFCHPGAAPSNLDLRFSHTLAPPERCTIIERMRATDATRMPPIGATTTHDAAVTAVADWIRTVQPCP